MTGESQHAQTTGQPTIPRERNTGSFESANEAERQAHAAGPCANPDDAVSPCGFRYSEGNIPVSCRAGRVRRLATRAACSGPEEDQSIPARTAVRACPIREAEAR